MTSTDHSTAPARDLPPTADMRPTDMRPTDMSPTDMNPADMSTRDMFVPPSGGVNVRPIGGGVAWPPKNEGWSPDTSLLPIKTFPRHYWDPWRYAFRTIDEMSQLAWKEAIEIERPTEVQLTAELAQLIEWASTTKPMRSSMMPEILAQDGDASRYWQSMLMFNARSHPWTFQVMQMAFHVGRFLAMYYKAQFNVPRPSQLSPAVIPWIDVPPHPSFPSGHALEGMLMSLSLAEVVPAAKGPLVSLARRVGHNREIAGLHYRNDTLVGFDIADQAVPILKRCSSFDEAVTAARYEWASLMR